MKRRDFYKAPTLIEWILVAELVILIVMVLVVRSLR